jgi:hypothetical protein
MILHDEDRIAQPAGGTLYDYVLTPYEAVAPFDAQQLHSATLLRSFLRAHAELGAAWEIVEALIAHLGPDKTVWGVKYDAERRPCIEFYFYNHCNNAACQPMSVSRLIDALRPVIAIPGEIDEAGFGYLMCSLELDAAMLAAGRAEGFRIYMPGVKEVDGHDGVSFLVRGRELVRENRYSFYAAEREFDALKQRFQRSFHGAHDAERLMPSSLRACYTICYAEKRFSDALYFSRITTDQLRGFAKQYLVGPLHVAIETHASALSHLRWDVGYDFVRTAEAPTSAVVKAGLYGFI